MKSRISAKFYLFLMLLFIFPDVICDNYIYHAFDGLSVIGAFVLFLGFSTAQIIASPVQAGFSVLYGKKKSLIFSLGISLICLFVVYLYLYKIVPLFFIALIALIIKGLLGNTTPLAWASIGDTNDTNFRFAFGLSTAGFAFAYLALVGVNKIATIKLSIIYVLILLALTLVCCILLFKNLKTPRIDREPNSSFKAGLLHEIDESSKEMRNKHIRNALIAFILWEVSLYSILLLYVDFDVSQFSVITFWMMSGYIITIVLLKFMKRVADKKMIVAGFCLLAFSLIPFFVMYPFIPYHTKTVFLSVCYFFHASGNALLSATIFAMLAKEKELGDQAVIYGLIASADTLAFFLSTVAIKLYTAFNFHLFVIIAFSFGAAILSWIPYKRFLKYRPTLPNLGG